MRVEPGGRVSFGPGLVFENGTPDVVVLEPADGGFRIVRAPEVDRALYYLEQATQSRSRRPMTAEETGREMDRIQMMQRRACEWEAGVRAREWAAGARALQGDRIIAGPEWNEQQRLEWEARRMRALEERVLNNQPPPMIVAQDELARLREIAGQAGAAPGLAREVPEYDRQAVRRARALLFRHLNLIQRRSFKEHGTFAVRGNRTGALYVINSVGKVIRHDDSHEFCLQVVGEPVPPEDAILARKILIETDERLFLGTANDLTERHVPARQQPWEEIRRQEAELQAQRERDMEAIRRNGERLEEWRMQNTFGWREWLRNRGL